MSKHMMIATTGRERQASECRANALLIADLLAACKARPTMSTTAPVKDRWQVVIDDRVESSHNSRADAIKRIAALRRAAIARAEGRTE